MKETTKRLRAAELCIRKAVKERDESHRYSLLFQFSKQIALACDRMALEQTDKVIRNRLFDYASTFDKLAELFKRIGEKSGKEG